MSSIVELIRDLLIFVVAMFVSLRVFGHSELRLVLVRTRALLRSIFLPRPRNASEGWEDAVRLQGTRQWNLLWDTLTECAVRLDFVQLRPNGSGLMYKGERTALSSYAFVGTPIHAVADGVVVTGSFNLSNHAMGNAENVLLIQNTSCADAYADYIQRLISIYS